MISKIFSMTNSFKNGEQNFAEEIVTSKTNMHNNAQANSTQYLCNYGHKKIGTS